MSTTALKLSRAKMYAAVVEPRSLEEGKFYLPGSLISTKPSHDTNVASFSARRSDVARLTSVVWTSTGLSHLRESHGDVHGAVGVVVRRRRAASAAQTAEFTKRVAELAAHRAVDEEVDGIAEQDEEIQQQRRKIRRL